MKGTLISLATLSLLLTTTGAHALVKGTSMIAIEIGQGTADVVDPEQNQSLWQPAPVPEISAQVEFWHAFADDYAFNISGGAGYFSMNAEPMNKTANSTIKLTTTSFHARVGGDRVGQVGDRLTLFLGPGIEFWSGKAKEKYEDGPPASRSEETGPTTTRFGLSGRIGGFMKLSESVSLTGRIGHTWGYASVDKDGAKTTWLPSSFDGAGGVVFAFGAK